MSFENLETALNVTPTEPVEITKVDVVSNDLDSNIKTDYDSSRQSIYELSNKMNKLLDNAIQDAIQSGHPRAYEVSGQLGRTYLDVISSLSTLNTEQQKLTGQRVKNNSTTNNNVFIGSTAELQKYIRIHNNKDKNK